MDFTFIEAPSKALSLSCRTVKKRVGTTWISCAFFSLKPGDVFQLFDSGVLYVNDEGVSLFECGSLPFEQFGVLTVECGYAQNKISSADSC